MSSKLSETSKAVSHLYFSITILGACEYFLMFMKTPWADSTEEMSVHSPGSKGNGGIEGALLLTIY